MTKSRSAAAGTGGLVALAAALACLAAVNYLAGGLRWRRDLTEDKLYTISQGTRNILAELERPVTLTFYFSQSMAETPTYIKTYARRVEDFLREYDLAGGRNLTFETVDPRPDTEAEEWAMRHGIEGHPFDRYGNRLFMGLTAVSGDARATIPMLDPNAEETLEYDITRMIVRVSRAAKPAIGVISRLPVLGRAAPPLRMPASASRDAARPWAAFQELQRDFEVRELTPPFDAVDADIRALVLAHPPDLDDAGLLAIDQYLLSGGALIAFLDPFCLAEMERRNDAGAFGGEPPVSSRLEPLTSAWGIGWDTDGIVADIEAATQVQGHDGRLEENPLLLSLSENSFDPGEIVTAGLQRMLLPLSGSFAIDPVEGLEYLTVIASSPNAMVTDGMSARFGVQTLLRNFRAADEPFKLALRVRGKFPTAFPDGIDAADAGVNGEPSGAESPDARIMPQLRESRRPGMVLLVGNVDMLHDPYAVRQMPFFFGAHAMQPINDNIAFLLNAVEQASGGMDLLAIRSRGRSTRPFTRVQELERQARLRWVDEEQRLQSRLQETRRRLSALRAEGDESQGVILTESQRREIERFQEEQARTAAALRNVRKNLREDIERLGLRLKIINIVLAPALVILGGLAFAFARRMRMRRVAA